MIKMFFLLLPFFNGAKKCADLDYWLLNCTIPHDTVPYTITCPKNGKYPLICTPIDGVVCENSSEIITRTINCYPTEGKSPGTALCLSVILGFLGVDRFYLGYPTIGIFKLFTGGFFGLGWYLDFFLIALRIVKPARGGVYQLDTGANFRVRLPGPEYY